MRACSANDRSLRYPALLAPERRKTCTARWNSSWVHFPPMSGVEGMKRSETGELKRSALDQITNPDTSMLDTRGGLSTTTSTPTDESVIPYQNIPLPETEFVLVSHHGRGFSLIHSTSRRSLAEELNRKPVGQGWIGAEQTDRIPALRSLSLSALRASSKRHGTITSLARCHLCSRCTVSKRCKL